MKFPLQGPSDVFSVETGSVWISDACQSGKEGGYDGQRSMAVLQNRAGLDLVKMSWKGNEALASILGFTPVSHLMCTRDQNKHLCNPYSAMKPHITFNQLS